jgi:hypothetical protein
MDGVGQPKTGMVVAAADVGTGSFGWWADDQQCGTTPLVERPNSRKKALSAALGEWLRADMRVCLGFEAPTWAEVPNHFNDFGRRSGEPSSLSWLTGPGAASRGALSLVLPRLLQQATEGLSRPVKATVDPTSFLDSSMRNGMPQLLFWEAFVSSKQDWWKPHGAPPNACCGRKRPLPSHRLDAWAAVSAFREVRNEWRQGLQWSSQPQTLAPWGPRVAKGQVVNQLVMISEGIVKGGNGAPLVFPAGEGSQPCLVIRASK